jgi:hypothetical protein
MQEPGIERKGSGRDQGSRFGVQAAAYADVFYRWDQTCSRLLCLAVVSVAALCTGQLQAQEPSSFADRLAALAKKCDELGLAEQAAITRRWDIERHPGRQYLFLPIAGETAAPKAGGPQVQQQWYAKFLELRRERAESLFAASLEASRQRQPTRAYQLLYEVLREDPDHAEARRVLGYTKNPRGQWTLPLAANLSAQSVRFDHPKLGWRRGTYWRLETPHFQILTNHSAKEALEAGRQLEDLHALWRQIFFRYWSTPEALAARLAGRNEPLAPQRPKMNVVLFKSREEYAAQLNRSQPQIGITLGYYQDRERTAFFFAGDASVHPTWYHEATHQLFQEGVPRTVAQPGEERNFALLEGAALYMESLQELDGYWTAGGVESDRLQSARFRRLSGSFAIPIERLVALGRDDLQASDDIVPLYAQAAAVAHFLIDGEGGEHREAFVDLLTAVYRGADATDTLAQATDQSFAALDEQYRRFLDVSDDDLATIPNPSRLRNLSLGHTRVSDRGLAYLAEARSLQWLDLAHTAVGDSGLAHLAGATGLKQLFLDGTQVTAASLPVIAGFKQLEDLDLARLPIGDGDLPAIAGLRNLRALYLEACPITDAGLVHLRGLRQLETLDTDGTQVTLQGRRRLEQTLPKLKSP